MTLLYFYMPHFCHSRRSLPYIHQCLKYDNKSYSNSESIIKQFKDNLNTVDLPVRVHRQYLEQDEYKAGNYRQIQSQLRKSIHHTIPIIILHDDH